MDLGLDDAQEQARRDLADRLGRESPPAVVRRAEPLGFDPALWATCAPALVASADGPLLDAALAAEEYGRVLAPVPVAEAIAGRRLLRDLGRVIGPADVVTLALMPAQDGVARLVPAGAVAHLAAAIVGDDIVVVERAPSGAAPSNLGTSPLADVEVATGTVVASGPDAIARFERAVDDWRVLTAALLVGVSDGALDLAVAHVSQREQFGVPIGTFQSVQHRLADLATDRDGARLLTRKAAWAADEQQPGADALAAMASWFAASTAAAVATDSLHFHGGWGFTLALDVQLYLRRAKAWPLALGDPDRELLTVARRCFDAGDAPMPVGS